MTDKDSRKSPIRKKRAPRFGLVESFILIFVLFAGVELFSDYIGRISTARSNAERQFVQASNNVRDKLGHIHDTATVVLNSARAHRNTGLLDPADARSANALFISYMRQYPFITSINSGDAAGNGYLILHIGELWKNRIKRANEKGAVTWLALDAEEKVISTERRRDDYDPRTRPWYRNSVDREEVVWSDPYIFRTTGDVGVTAAMRLDGGNGRGEVVGVDIMLKDLSLLLAGLTAETAGLTAHIIARDGTVVACSEIEQFLALLKQDNASLPGIGTGRYPMLDTALRSRTGGRPLWSFTSGNKRFLAIMEPVSSSPHGNFKLVLTVPEEALVGNFAHDALQEMVGVFLLLAAAGAGFFFRYIIPLRRIAEAMKDFGSGKFRKLPVDASRKDEIGALASEFIQMTDALTAKDEFLRESEERYRTLADSGHALVWTTGTDKKADYFNRKWLEFTGRTPAQEMGDGWLEGVHPEDLQNSMAAYLDAFERREEFSIEYRLRRHDGEYRWIQDNGCPRYAASAEFIGYIGHCLDVTEHRKLEEQLHHSQKMESIGTLAGGIAHDFNNILTAIIGYGTLAFTKMAETDPQRLNIQRMLAASDRAARLTRDLLLFSRKQPVDRKTVDLNVVVAKVEDFIKRVIGEDIACKTILRESPLPVLADGYQLEQVLINLATNARDAMPHGGALTVTTGHVLLSGEFVSAHGYGKPGPYALITVTDSGAGMDEATRQRIFEPFFTTKEVGKGTGLGLAVTYGIIKQHDGYINVYSEPGAGATFRIYLPVLPAEAGEEILARRDEPAVGGAETILLAEDDESVRELTRSVLTEAGYTVIEAGDGEDAVKKFTEFSEAIDLLLFDLIMPKMNGKEAFDEIRKIRPRIRAIFSSGYAPDTIRQKASLADGVQLISKPVSPPELLRMVRCVLDEER